MTTSALRGLPTRWRVTHRVVSALAVGATLYVLDGSPRVAGGTALGFLLLTLTGDAAEAILGDYADNAVLGLLILAFTVGFLRSWVPGLIGGLLVGGWFLFDGVQHLRNGDSRDALATPYAHDGSPLTGIPRALAARLLEPFRL